MDTATLIAVMAQRNGLTLQPDADGKVHFAVDGDLALSIEPITGGSGFLLVARLAAVPRKNRDGVLTTMLSLNLLDRRWSGTFLAIDADSDAIMLCRRYDGDPSYDVFQQELEKFIDRMESLLDQLFHASEQTPASTTFDLSEQHLIRV